MEGSDDRSLPVIVAKTDGFLKGPNFQETTRIDNVFQIIERDRSSTEPLLSNLHHESGFDETRKRFAQGRYADLVHLFDAAEVQPFARFETVGFQVVTKSAKHFDRKCGAHRSILWVDGSVHRWDHRRTI